MTLAVNYGSASGSTAYALAAGWGPASGRFQISGAIGGVRPGYRRDMDWLRSARRRAAVPECADRFGVALFGGVGGASRDTTSFVRVPVASERDIVFRSARRVACRPMPRHFSFGRG